VKQCFSCNRNEFTKVTTFLYSWRLGERLEWVGVGIFPILTKSTHFEKILEKIQFFSRNFHMIFPECTCRRIWNITGHLTCLGTLIIYVMDGGGGHFHHRGILFYWDSLGLNLSYFFWFYIVTVSNFLFDYITVLIITWTFYLSLINIRPTIGVK